MGDYAPLSVLVYDVPRHLHTAVADAIAGWLIDYEPRDLLRAVAEGDALLVDGQVNVCALDALVSTLDELRQDGDILQDDPDSPDPDNPHPIEPGEFGYVAWADPYDQWLGSLRAYRPGHGTFTAECDSDGNPVLRGPDLLQLIDTLTAPTDPAGSLQAVRAGIVAASGGPWLERLREVTA